VSTILACPSCGAKNRVGPLPRGTPRCAKCKTALPWVVAADESTFAAERAGALKVVKVNVDENPQLAARFAPKAQLEQRLAAHFS
jgi:hypothetical protein